MAEKKKTRLIDLVQTRGSFSVSGLVTGTDKDSFYEDKLTQSTKKPFRSVNFGVKIDKDGSSVYTYLNDMERKSVYYSRREDKAKGITKDTQEVAWKDRYTFDKEGYRMIGVNVGVKKIVDKKGNEVNDKKVLTEFDACEEIGTNLKDDASVFVKGNLEFSTYNDKHNVRLVPTQVSLCRPIDMEAEDYTPNAQFTQVIVFTGIEPNEDKTKFTVSAKIVNYESIEDAEFVIYDSKLATAFRKNIKPYSSIKVWGDIIVERDIEEVEEASVWGTANKMERVNSPTQRLFVITGADPQTIDTEEYSEDKIDKAIAKIAASKKAEDDYGSSNSNGGNWGKSLESNDELDDDEPW